MALIFVPATWALPVGGVVTAGGASIANGLGATTVAQSSQNAAIDWQGFSIGQGEVVRFVQPNASAVALNRVVGSDVSSILGRLSANGQVFLINPNGIVFGAGAQVNVGGLVASTLNVSDSDLTQATRHFSGGATGAIVNRGTITAQRGGYVALLANRVSNQGTINAPAGSVALGAASAVALSFDNNRLLSMQVDQGAVNALVENKQLIVAESGQVLMSATAKDKLLASVVNNSGVIQANGVSTDGGVVRLLASGGNVTASGTIDVSGVHGGSVQLLSDRDVLLTGLARIDASGAQGGGQVRIGGGAQGGEGLPRAERTYMADGATVNADATSQGNGGTVVVWSDTNTVVAGSLSARGGATGGAGGWVETSSHGGLAMSRAPVVAAAFGAPGTWLIDPYDINIVAGSGATNINNANPFAATGNTASLGVGLITTALTNGA
ncbi:MAG: filamentous hemagglutinin N-terminal domain-containing protein, partial [Rhodoferax sp.]